MRNLFAKDAVALEAGHAVSGIAEQVRTLRVISGRIWLTIEGALDDHWLVAGDSVTLKPNRLIVLEADAIDSRIESVCVEPCLRQSPAQFRLWPAVQRWIAARFAGKAFVPNACSSSRISHCHTNAR